MKILQFNIALVSVLLLPGVLTAAQPTAKPAVKSPAPPSTTNAAPAVEVAEIPQSMFELPTSAKEGRNPFFPRSNATLPVHQPPKDPFDPSSIVLNGITSPPKRTAMINGRTFEPGEEAEVRTPSGGKLLIKCTEIKSDSAIIVVGGQRKELRLRFGI